MAIYHASTKAISRGKGRSATGAAAYRSGELILDKRTGLVHDYRKKEGVEYSEIITPDETKISREDLWNLAELSEKRKDARVAREWEVALPSELNQEEKTALAIGFGSALCQRYGVAVDVCIHEPSKAGDERNYHVHLLLTTREFKAGNLGAKALSELDNKQRKALNLCSSQEDIKEVRALWAKHANLALEQGLHLERVDARSYRDQGLDEIPTIKMGQTATQLERRGVLTDRGNINRHTMALNCDIYAVKREKVDLVLEKENVAKNVEKMLEKGIDNAWARFEERQKKKELEKKMELERLELEEKLRLKQERTLKNKDDLQLDRSRGRGFSL